MAKNENTPDEFICVNCGHHNFAHTQEQEVLVSDLRPSDVGLAAGTHGRADRVLIGFKRNTDPDARHLFTASFFDPNAEAYREPDTTKHYFYNESDTITIARPI